MFGCFKSTKPALGGLLWKIPWKMSNLQKARQRGRLQQVDKVLDNLKLGLHVSRCESKNIPFEKSIVMKKLLKPRVKSLAFLSKPKNFPREEQMSPVDKYTIYSKYSKGYRKGIHKVPKWTRLSNRRNPQFF
ncbi:mitochondrial 54S ribosomal protein mL60 SCDLUD_003987 [Saccharomycodes ludwigii]|uniref:mitochondrial 54S ribosomal protein mL60 n=1 Tax=Saccharomycodes ludwigii TaxID=36035 RepID=UPI001E85E9FD|nr:hypothetical protein SCDLUD_003987 [Saccharomycodes ludwigii]KAH3899702.1 hypothetical protein SCDLUD_003987 [Saccharomycodes ludwigii]